MSKANINVVYLILAGSSAQSDSENPEATADAVLQIGSSCKRRWVRSVPSVPAKLNAKSLSRPAMEYCTALTVIQNR